MYAQAAIKPNTLLHNGAYGIVMRGVQKCTCAGASLRGRNSAPLCCIKLDTATDPACGSGGFILTAMNYIFDNIDNSTRSTNSKEVLKRNVVHQLFGIDISPKLVKIAKANMLLGKDGHGGIEHANSLDSVSTLSAHFNELCGIGKPNIILTNPPFGSGHDLRIKEANILAQYKNGYQWEISTNSDIVYSDKLNERQGVAPELLFLEKCLEWVKEDGIIGIVMAKG